MELLEYNESYDLLQNRDSLLYKMVQHLGEVEATVLIERAKQVSLLQGVVIEVCFQIHSSGISTRGLCALFSHKPPETKLHDWVLTACGRLKAGLLRICNSGGDGV